MNIISKLKFMIATAVFAMYLNAALAGTPAKGDPFPDVSKYGLEGTLPQMAGKVVLVDFFASWCGPCQESFPAMEKLHQKYGPRGLVILAINLDKKPEDMQIFLKGHPVTFATVRDGSYKLVNEVKIPTMPSSFLLDPSGKVVAVHRGFEGGKTEKQYVEEIETLLKDQH
jgi:thiol-disulfide isomerase/thioredoxin